jgi:hypothetical protein
MIWFPSTRNRLQKSSDQFRRLLRKRNAGNTLVNFQQRILLLSLASRLMRAPNTLRVEIHTRLLPSGRLPSSISSNHLRRRIRTARRALASQLRLDPARVQRRALHLRPALRHSIRKHDVVHLSIIVRLRRLELLPLRPRHILQTLIATHVQPGANIKQPLRPLHQSSENERRERVDGENRSHAVRGFGPVGGESQACIVDDRVEGPGLVGFGREGFAAGHGREVADYDAGSLGDGGQGLRGAGAVAGVQEDGVACSARILAAAWPMPSAEPVMKTRAMVLVLVALFSFRVAARFFLCSFVVVEGEISSILYYDFQPMLRRF